MIHFQTKLHEFSLPREQKQQYQPWSLQVIDNQKIGVFYVDRFQIWNYISKKLIFSSQNEKIKGFFNHPRFISKTDLLVLNKNGFSNQELLHFSIYEHGGHEVTHYQLSTSDFQHNNSIIYTYENLIYCQKSETVYSLRQMSKKGYTLYSICQSSKNIVKLNLNTKLIETQTMLSDGQIFKYNEQSICIFRKNLSENIFEIFSQNQRTKYPLKCFSHSISVIKEYSPEQAIIGLKTQQDHSIIILYSLKQKTQIKCISVAIPSIQNLICFSESWIAMTTSYVNSNVKLMIHQCVFQNKANNESQILIQQSLWNYNNSSIKSKEYYFIASAGRCVQDKLNIKIVQLVMKKRLLYIHLLEKSGLIQAFDNDIVKEVINNLF